MISVGEVPKVGGDLRCFGDISPPRSAFRFPYFAKITLDFGNPLCIRINGFSHNPGNFAHVCGLRHHMALPLPPMTKSMSSETNHSSRHRLSAASPAGLCASPI